MSTRRRKRRRARERRHETDAMDLFLDAICNTLGVVMFVLLVVATFAAPPEAPAATAPVVDPSRLQALQRPIVCSLLLSTPDADIQNVEESCAARALRLP